MRKAQQQAWARHFACYDLVTGLPRRSVLAERLAESLFQAGRRGRHVALLLVDVEPLEGIRNRWGWPAADAVLQHVAEALARSVRGADTVCRCGGERFSMILSDVDSPAMAMAAADRIREVLGSLSLDEIDGGRLDSRIGVAVSSLDGDEAAALIRRAELAATY
ncbi:MULTISPECIES: diguanylate cyclase domain-containing protein [unclassified Thioalkalivibrio]|uniref:diguanylate cyclase domain-containing protein n=1 Tax=unclassified Thioalkalivibrio TaxID=2621013 RepID=UPI00035E3859|nr:MULTISPECIES: diguanylate cyclase [unclassified Thioalkalivibrio]